MPFGEMLSALLKERKMSVAELSRRTGINQNTLYSYLRRGSRRPDPVYLGAIADALGTTISQLLDVDVPENLAEAASDNELWELREALRRNPEMRTLFSVSKTATPDQLRQTIAIIEALKKSNDKSNS